jgi:hypothetical protein
MFPLGTIGGEAVSARHVFAYWEAGFQSFLVVVRRDNLPQFLYLSDGQCRLVYAISQLSGYPWMFSDPVYHVFLEESRRLSTVRPFRTDPVTLLTDVFPADYFTVPIDPEDIRLWSRS